MTSRHTQPIGGRIATATVRVPTQRALELLGQTVVVVGGSAGVGLEARRAELRTKLPIGRGWRPADVAALAVHLMINSAVTGATYASTAADSSSRERDAAERSRR